MLYLAFFVKKKAALVSLSGDYVELITELFCVRLREVE